MVRPAFIGSKHVHTSSVAFIFAGVGRQPGVQIATSYRILKFAPEASSLNLGVPLFHWGKTSIWYLIFLRVMKKGLSVFTD